MLFAIKAGLLIAFTISILMLGLGWFISKYEGKYLAEIDYALVDVSNYPKRVKVKIKSTSMLCAMLTQPDNWRVKIGKVLLPKIYARTLKLRQSYQFTVLSENLTDFPCSCLFRPTQLLAEAKHVE